MAYSCNGNDERRCYPKSYGGKGYADGRLLVGVLDACPSTKKCSIAVTGEAYMYKSLTVGQKRSISHVR